ncbi:hypothetical protein GE061_007558 [Apolygus lucorum]|nr:hypothetical protein GE061_007558 [Apolygus lucorum]
MYIQCKAYMQICQRWKAFNRVIYVQNAPEKQTMPPTPPPPSAPVESSTSSGQTVPKPRQYSDAANYKDETSIDLKGVRNLHIFFQRRVSCLLYLLFSLGVWF